MIITIIIITITIPSCEGLPFPHYIPASQYYTRYPTVATNSNSHKKTDDPPVAKMTLNSITEPSVCSYKAVVCTPLLCKDPAFLTVSTTTITTTCFWIIWPSGNIVCSMW